MGIQTLYRHLIDGLLRESKLFYGANLWSIVLFGSVARGTAVSDSDLDILIVASGLPRGRLHRVREFMTIENRLAPVLDAMDNQGIHTTLSPIFKTPEELQLGSWLFLDFIDDAVILVDKNNLFRQHLDALQAKLTKLGSRKIKHGDQWYWVLKPDYKPGDVIDL